MTRGGSRVRMEPARCAWCGIDFQRNAGSGPTPIEPHCSRACRGLLTKRRAGLWTPAPGTCDWCHGTFMPTGPHARYCTPQCGFRARDRRPRMEHHRLRDLPCAGCGKPTETRGTKVRCAVCTKERERRNNHVKNTRRRGARAGTYALREIGERDGWRCHLCRTKVDASLSGRHPDGPTIDHLVPLADGGKDEPMNVAIAHRRCNVRRGTGGTVQLRLVA